MSRCTEVWLALIVVAATARVAAAHDSARSSFEAGPASAGMQVVFRLDAQSIADLVEPAEAHVLAYLDRNFIVTREGQPCPREAPRSYGLDATANVLVIDVVYRCSDTLRLESTLFHDESIPHQVIGMIRSGGRAERYFFTRSERAKTVDMQPPAVGGFRTAAPPPGAFSGPPRPSAPEAPDAAEAQPIGSGFGAFYVDGVRHILGGLDHLLFVCSLLLAVSTWRRLALVITAFTIAHSLTLVLGALGLVVVSPRLVEPLIAASILFVVIENLIRTEGSLRSRGDVRAGVVFGFGLVHGLGFSGVLSSLGFSGADLALPLIGFNLGVETGQLLIVAPLFPLLTRMRRAHRPLCIVIAVISAFWLVERLVA